MTTAYFDCFAGAGGDMIVGALLDAGAGFDALSAELSKLNLAGYSLGFEKVTRGGLAGTKFNVTIDEHDHSHRHIGQVLSIIDAACLAPRVADRAKRIFQRLAAAEAKVHQASYDEVHFHEVGAVDSILDVVGACVALELLGVERVFCSPIPVGSGSVQCEHGLLPVPSPAAVELLVGAAIVPGDPAGEMTTPTAAAVLTTLTVGYGGAPAMDVKAVGYGAGSRTGGKLPNLLRVLVGEPADLGTADTVVEVWANIDDCTGEVLGAALDKLLAAGCVDAWAAPILMKKSRPAWTVCALCFASDVQAVEEILFAETTTFGLRRRTCERSKLRRLFETVETAYGPVRIKIGSIGERIVTASPEFSDCAAAAEAHHVSVREVLADAQAVYRGKKRA